MNNPDGTKSLDKFDRMLGALHNLPDVASTNKAAGKIPGFMRKSKKKGK